MTFHHRALNKNGELLFGAKEKCDLGEFVYQNKERVLTQKHGRPCLWL